MRVAGNVRSNRAFSGTSPGLLGTSAASGYAASISQRRNHVSQQKPSITCLPDGPYLLKNDDDTPVTLQVPTADGEQASAVKGVALCRCGGSANKPFCDGTHRNNGFSDARIADGSLDRRESYVGGRITIHDNRGICAHAGFCTDNLASVFRMGEEPWIDADGATVEAVIEVIRKCPSGALGYTIDDSEFRHPDDMPEITVIRDGPYRVSGVELAGQQLGEGATSARYTLCRCGASKNKPFCDGSHWHVGFRDDAD